LIDSFSSSFSRSFCAREADAALGIAVRGPARYFFGREGGGGLKFLSHDPPYCF